MGLEISPQQSKNAADELEAIDNLDDSVLINSPELKKEADAFNKQLTKNTLDRDLQKDDPDVQEAAEAMQELLELIDEFGVQAAIPEGLDFDDLLDSGTGLANFFDNPAAAAQAQKLMEKLDKALDTEKKLEGKAADLLIAASEGAVTPSVAKGGMDVQGKAANDAGMNGQGGDQHGTATDNTMTGQMAQDLVSMPLETQMQIMGQMSPSQQGEMMEKFEHQLTELLENFDGSRESMQEINDLLMSMRALGNQMPKSEGMPDVGPMAAAVTGESGEDIQKMLIDGILEQTKKDRDDFNEKLGELDGSSGGASGAGGGGASGSIKRIAAVLGQLSEEIFDKLEAKGKALGDEPTTGEVAEFQGDSAVAQAFYKAATEIINQLGKAMSDGVKTRG